MFESRSRATAEYYVLPFKIPSPLSTRKTTGRDHHHHASSLIDSRLIQDSKLELERCLHSVSTLDNNIMLPITLRILQHCQRLPCCRIPMAISGRRHFALLSRNSEYAPGDPAPKKSTHWQTRLKITGGIIFGVLGVYYVSQ
jgi:hypothetical protein